MFSSANCIECSTMHVLRAVTCARVVICAESTPTKCRCVPTFLSCSRTSSHRFKGRSSTSMTCKLFILHTSYYYFNTVLEARPLEPVISGVPPCLPKSRTNPVTLTQNKHKRQFHSGSSLHAQFPPSDRTSAPFCHYSIVQFPPPNCRQAKNHRNTLNLVT